MNIALLPIKLSKGKGLGRSPIRELIAAEMEKVTPSSLPARRVLTCHWRLRQNHEFARIQREAAENSEASFFERTKKLEAEQAAKKETQRQADANRERDHLIDNYTINLGPGRLDIARQERLKADLRKIDVKSNGRLIGFKYCKAGWKSIEGHAQPHTCPGQLSLRPNRQRVPRRVGSPPPIHKRNTAALWTKKYLLLTTIWLQYSQSGGSQ